MMNPMGMMMLQSIAALAAVLALFAALVWGMKRLQHYTGSSTPTSGMRVLQRVSLGTRHSMVEVEYGEQRYLLGLSSTGIDLIDHIAMPKLDEPSADTQTHEH